MELLQVAVLVLTCIGMVVNAADKSFCGGPVCVKVLGQSGKFMMAVTNDTQKISSHPDRVTIEMDSVKELDASGNAVGTGGNIKHSLNTFASQDFSFSEIEDTQLSNVSASRLNFSSTIDLGAIIDVQIFIFKESGTVEVNDESINVTKGSVKFGIEITNWEFCGCKKGQTDEVGTTIEFTIKIKGKGNASKSSGEGEKYALDDAGTTVVMNKKLNKDGTVEDMENNYPMLNDKGQFMFRFPKFMNKVSFDPTVNLAVSDDSGTTPSSGTTAGPTDDASSSVVSMVALVSSLLIATML